MRGRGPSCAARIRNECARLHRWPVFKGDAMKRRDFVKTSVGAGIAYSIFPLEALAQRRTGGKTMYDKIWE